MPKRKREEEEEKKKPVMLTLYERWDVSTFNAILELVLKPKVEEKLVAISPSINSLTTAKRKVEYRTGEFEQGRLYGTGLQSISKWIRKLCAHLYYSDIDMVNAGPTLFAQLLVRNKVPCPPLLKIYAEDRSQMFARIREQLPDKTDEKLKKLLLKLSHGGMPTDDAPILIEYRTQIQEAADQLKNKPRYTEMYKERLEAKEENPIGSFISCAWQEVENKVLMALVDFFQTTGKTVGFLAFDGLGVEKHENMDLAGAEAAVLAQTGYKVKLIEKSLKPTQEDYNRFWGERALNKIASPYMRQVYLLYRTAQLAGLKRQGGSVVEPHVSIPGVFSTADDADVFINRVLSGVWTGADVCMKRLIDWFNEIDHPMFELLHPSKMKRNIISFTNGFFDIDTMKFTVWGGPEPVPLTDHFFEQSLDLNTVADVSTPLWDHLIATQLGPRGKCESCDRTAVYADNTCDLHCDEYSASFGYTTPSLADTFEMMVGRCFYPIGKYDNWQVAIFMLGDAGTGKGTICDLIKHMFPANSTGAITASHEKTFGLEPLFQKRAVIVPDLPKHFSTIVNQSDFQSMCSGEGVSIARKNKTAVTNKNWTVPLIFGANYLPDYSDNSGSVSRRLVVFPFVKLIEERNTVLKDEILEKETVAVLVRCITAYRRTVARHRGADFWTRIASPDLLDIQTETKERTNPLTAFIANGDDYYQIVFSEGSVTPLCELEKAYCNHMRIHHKQERARLGTDYHPLKQAGYIVERVHLCKICHMQCSRTTCGDHYNAANRYKKVVVKNMLIKRV